MDLLPTDPEINRTKSDEIFSRVYTILRKIEYDFSYYRKEVKEEDIDDIFLGDGDLMYPQNFPLHFYITEFGVLDCEVSNYDGVYRIRRSINLPPEKSISARNRILKLIEKKCLQPIDLTPLLRMYPNNSRICDMIFFLLCRFPTIIFCEFDLIESDSEFCLTTSNIMNYNKNYRVIDYVHYEVEMILNRTIKIISNITRRGSYSIVYSCDLINKKLFDWMLENFSSSELKKKYPLFLSILNKLFERDLITSSQEKLDIAADLYFKFPRLIFDISDDVFKKILNCRKNIHTYKRKIFLFLFDLVFSRGIYTNLKLLFDLIEEFGENKKKYGFQFFPTILIDRFSIDEQQVYYMILRSEFPPLIEYLKEREVECIATAVDYLGQIIRDIAALKNENFRNLATSIMDHIPLPMLMLREVVYLNSFVEYRKMRYDNIFR